jgi:hypothetical protein
MVFFMSGILSNALPNGGSRWCANEQDEAHSGDPIRPETAYSIWRPIHLIQPHADANRKLVCKASRSNIRLRNGRRTALKGTLGRFGLPEEVRNRKIRPVSMRFDRSGSPNYDRIGKKEGLPCPMENMRLGNPFPRSALFLKPFC